MATTDLKAWRDLKRDLASFATMAINPATGQPWMTGVTIYDGSPSSFGKPCVILLRDRDPSVDISRGGTGQTSLIAECWATDPTADPDAPLDEDALSIVESNFLNVLIAWMQAGPSAGYDKTSLTVHEILGDLGAYRPDIASRIMFTVTWDKRTM